MLRAELGTLLQLERHGRGLSLRELAGQAGISATYLGEIERGLKEPSFEVVEALAQTLGLQMGELLRRLADRIDPPAPARAIGFSLRGQLAAGQVPAVQALTNQLSQEEIYALTRFGKFLLQERSAQLGPGPADDQ